MEERALSGNPKIWVQILTSAALRPISKREAKMLANPVPQLVVRIKCNET